MLDISFEYAILHTYPLTRYEMSSFNFTSEHTVSRVEQISQSLSAVQLYMNDGDAAAAESTLRRLLNREGNMLTIEVTHNHTDMFFTADLNGRHYQSVRVDGQPSKAFETIVRTLATEFDKANRNRE